jgi:hypothetical protein
LPGDEFDVVDRGAERDFAQRQCVADFRSGFFTGHHGGTDAEVVGARM